MTRKLLLVEDEELVGLMVRLNLESEGFEVEWARDGEAGLEAARAGAHEVILLDISMPGRTGIEVLQALRGDGVTTPVLMITARSDVQTKVSTLELGADDYLTKPFDVNELIARVRALVRRSGSGGRGSSLTLP